MKKGLQRTIALSLTASILIGSTRPSHAQGAVIVPTALGAGAVLLGIVIIKGLSYRQWQKSDGTIFNEPLYQARPKKVRVVPGQMDIFGGTITTSEECQKMGGKRWQADSSLGTKDGKNLGRCT